MPCRPSIEDEQMALQFAVFLGLSATDLATALKIGVLVEVALWRARSLNSCVTT